MERDEIITWQSYIFEVANPTRELSVSERGYRLKGQIKYKTYLGNHDEGQRSHTQPNWRLTKWNNRSQRQENVRMNVEYTHRSNPPLLLARRRTTHGNSAQPPKFENFAIWTWRKFVVHRRLLRHGMVIFTIWSGKIRNMDYYASQQPPNGNFRNSDVIFPLHWTCNFRGHTAKVWLY